MAIDFDALDLVRSRNKANRHEALKKQKQQQRKKKIEIIKDLAKKLNLFCGATDRAEDNGFKYLYMDKADRLIKKYKTKL
jgi:hypothetical protein